MDRKRIEALVEDARKYYNSKGMPCFEGWLKKYEDKDEFQYAKSLYDFLLSHNSHAHTRIFSIDALEVSALIEYLINNSPQQVS